MLTTAILAVCASFYQSRRERRHQRKMASCTPEAAVAFGMMELPSGGNNGGLRRSSQPKTDVGENVDRMAPNHRGGGSAATTTTLLPTTTSMNGGVINRTCLTSSLPPSYSGFGDETIVPRESRSRVITEGQHANHRATPNHITSLNATGQAFQPLNSSQYEPTSLAGTVSGGTISAVATIEKQPPSPTSATRSSSLSRRTNNGCRGREDNTTSLRHDHEDFHNETLYYCQLHADNSTSNNNGVQRPYQHQINTAASSAISGEVISESARLGGQLSLNYAVVRSTIVCDNESDAIVGRRMVASSGWAATVKPLPSNCRSANVHNRHSNHIAFGENTSTSLVLEPYSNTAVASAVHPTTSNPSRPMSLPVDVADTTMANRRQNMPPPQEVLRAAQVSDVLEDGVHVQPTSHHPEVRSNQSAISSRSELPSDSIRPYNTRPYKGTHSIVF